MVRAMAQASTTHTTGAGDDEAYFAIPGAALAAVEERLAVMVNANRELEKFHRGRLPRA